MDDLREIMASLVVATVPVAIVAFLIWVLLSRTGLYALRDALQAAPLIGE